MNMTTLELEELGQQFSKWRRNNPRRHHPRHLWDSALLLCQKYSCSDVSKQIGFSKEFVRRKLNTRQPPPSPKLKFVEVQPCQSDPPNVTASVKLRLQQPTGVVTDLSFTGDVRQLFPLIRVLLAGDD